MSTQITTKSDTSEELKSLAKRIRPAEDRVSALSRFNAEYGTCGGESVFSISGGQKPWGNLIDCITI